MAKTQGDHVIKGKFAADGNAKFNKGLDAPYLEVVDQKATGTEGGTFTGKSSGVHGWQTRDLTRALHNDFATALFSGDVDLEDDDPETVPVVGAGGQITLESGIYYVEISVPAANVDEHQARLADVTDNPGDTGDTVILGTTEYAADSHKWRVVPNTDPDNVSHEIFTHSSSLTRSLITGRFQIVNQRVLEIQHKCTSTQVGHGFGFDGNFYEVFNVFTTVKMWQIRDDT